MNYRVSHVTEMFQALSLAGRDEGTHGVGKKERGLEQVEPLDYPSLRSTFSRARRNYYFASPNQLRAWNRLVFLWVS